MAINTKTTKTEQCNKWKISALHSTGMLGTLSVQTKLSTIKKKVWYYINFKPSMK